MARPLLPLRLEGGGGDGGFDSGQRLIALLPERELAWPAHRQRLPLMGVEWFGKRAVQMGRPRVLGQGQPELIQGAEQKTGGDIGARGWQILAEERIAGEDTRLLDRLIGTALHQLHRAIGTENYQGDAALARFNHRRIEVGHCGARGGDQSHGATATLG